MTRLDKFEDLNRWFISLGTRMTPSNKFEDLNDRFTSLGTGMTQLNKFRDRWRTLLFQQHIGIFSFETQRSTVLYIDDHIWAVLCSQTAGSCSSNNLKFDSLTIYLLFTSSLLKGLHSFYISYLVVLYTLHTPFLFSIHTNMIFFCISMHGRTVVGWCFILSNITAHNENVCLN